MKIFLSYAREQTECAQELATSLRACGHRVFHDRSTLLPGDEFHHAIRRELRRADLAVFLISPTCVQNDRYVAREVALATERWPNPTGHVLPVLVHPTALDEIPGYLRTVTLVTAVHATVATVIDAVDRVSVGHRRRQMRRVGAALCFSACVAIGTALISDRETGPSATAGYRKDESDVTTTIIGTSTTNLQSKGYTSAPQKAEVGAPILPTTSSPVSGAPAEGSPQETADSAQAHRDERLEDFIELLDQKAADIIARLQMRARGAPRTAEQVEEVSRRFRALHGSYKRALRDGDYVAAHAYLAAIFDTLRWVDVSVPSGTEIPPSGSEQYVAGHPQFDAPPGEHYLFSPTETYAPRTARSPPVKAHGPYTPRLSTATRKGAVSRVPITQFAAAVVDYAVTPPRIKNATVPALSRAFIPPM